MMITNLYSIYDSAVKIHTSQFFFRNELEMLRALRQTMLDDQSLLSRFPDDFSVFLVGTFNTETGTVTPLEHPKMLHRLVDVTAETLNNEASE